MLKKGFWKKPGKWLIPLLGIGVFHSCLIEEEVSYQGNLSLEVASDTVLVQNQTRASSLLELEDFANTADYAVEILQGTTSVQKYDRYDKLPDEVSLKPGDYTIQVSKGKNEPAAYSSPYFTGKQDFTIVEGMTTPVTVTASMANSRVTVDLSDDFIETYPEYTLSFMTNKMKTPLEYEPGSPMYFQADAAGTKLTIAMELVNVYGKEVEYTATTTIKQKQWAALTVRTDEKGINGLAVDVTLNDGTNETIYVNIGIPDFMEQLKGAPLVSSSFFNWDGNESMTGAYALDVKDAGSFVEIPVVSVIAGGKVDKAILSVTKGDESILNVDLANLTEEEKSDLDAKYALGLPEEIKNQTSFDFNVTGLLNSFKPEKEKQAEYLISLSVTDALPEPHVTTKLVLVTLKQPNVPTFGNLETIAGTVGKFASPYDIEIQHDVDLTSYTFVLKNSNGETVQEGQIDLGNNTSTINGITWKEEENKGILSLGADWLNSLDGGKYTLTISVSDEVGNVVTKDISIMAASIEWNTEAGDMYAKYIVLRVKPIKENETIDPSKLRFIYNGETIAQGDDFETDNEVTYFVWKNLQSGSIYNNVIAEYDGIQTAMNCMTEEELQLPNNNFENWNVEKINCQIENASGTGIFATTYYMDIPSYSLNSWNINNSTIIQDCGNYWGLGDKRYLISYRSFPTVTIDNFNAVSIRSVGCGTSGDEDTDVGTVGWLKLQDNVTFTSRPKSMKFGYDFTSYNNESFYVSITVLDSNGNEIATGSFGNNASVSNAEGSVKLVYSNEVAKAASIKVEFLSSTVENGSTRVGKSTVTVPMDKNGTTTQFNITAGNVLTIKGIELIYDYE